MLIWVIGRHGMLARAVQRALTRLGRDFVATGQNEVDLSHPGAVADFAITDRAEWWINCTGYTQVDRAEAEEERANVLNARAVEELTQQAVARGACLVHVSTDYVFDGTSTVPYTENDAVAPRNAYGRTKRAGERALIDTIERCASARLYLVRTSWILGPDPQSFVSKIRKRIAEGHRLQVVDDQTGRATGVDDLAEALLRLAGIDSNPTPTGLYHFANSGATTWFDIADYVSRSLRGPDVEPVSTATLNLPAVRPRYSVLDTTKYEQTVGERPRPWTQVVDELLADPSTVPTLSDRSAAIDSAATAARDIDR